MMSTTGAIERQWLPAAEAAALAEVDLRVIMRLGRNGLVAVRKIPGCRPQYLRGDVEQLMRASIRPATVGVAR